MVLLSIVAYRESIKQDVELPAVVLSIVVSLMQAAGLGAVAFIPHVIRLQEGRELEEKRRLLSEMRRQQQERQAALSNGSF
jgi:hypothetical protein